MADPVTLTMGGLAAAGGLAQLGEAIFGSDEPSDWQKEKYAESIARQEHWAKRNEALQREFAQNGLRWKIADAQAAGIHPVAALGASTASFSPIAVGDIGPPSDRRRPSIGDSLGDMSQNISRAVRATATESDRLHLAMQEAQLEGQQLQNALLGQRLTAGANQTSQVGPAQPEESIIQPEVTYHKTKGGGIAPAPSQAFADRAEDQFIPQIAWAMRNMLLPDKPNRSVPKGHEWLYNPGRAEWEHGPADSFKWHIRTYNRFRKWMRDEK